MSPVSGILLAAGPCRRFGGRPKPLLELQGRPLVQRIATEAAASRLHDLVAVVGYQAERVGPLLGGRPIAVVENPLWEEGQSTSVRAGLAALPPEAGAAMFLMVDQPLLTAAVIDRLIAAWERTGGPIVVPVNAGRRGSPVIFDRSLFAELARITGDTGGRQLFAEHEAEIVEVHIDDAGALVDVDSPDEYERLLRSVGGQPPGTGSA